MSESDNPVIKQRVIVSGWRIMFAWFLLILLPIMISMPALDFFLREYANYIEPEMLSESINELETYKNSMVIENYLTARIQELSAIPCQPSESPEQIKGKIDAIVGGETLLCVLFDKERKHFRAVSSAPTDIASATPPGALFFKRQLLLLGNRPGSVMADRTEVNKQLTEKKRVAQSIQQAFKTLTPVTVRKERAVKNFSIKFGGDLYFLYGEFFDGSPDKAGFLAVLRGREFSESRMLKQLRSSFPYCATVLRKMEVGRIEKSPELFYSGVERLNDRLLITIPADQRFIRHVIHNGGITLKPDENHLVPFVQYHLPLKRFNHQFVGLKNWLKSGTWLLLVVSGVYCLNVGLFGFAVNVRFKTRILVMTLLAALFPFSFFSTGFYLHQQYERFLQRISLIQHINTRLEILNNELEHYISYIEGELTLLLQQINSTNFSNDEVILRIFAQAGINIPVTRLALQRVDSRISKEFPERSSGRKIDDVTAAIENFFPVKSLQLLREQEPLVRTRQDNLNIPGQSLKVEALGINLTSNGSLFSLDHAMFPIWHASMRVIDTTSSGRPVCALLLARFEPASLIRSFLAQSSLDRIGFQENFAGYRIKYAIFPTERSGAGAMWEGSGNINDPAILTAQNNSRSEMVVKRNEMADELLINRLNQGMPYNAVAHSFLVHAAGWERSPVSALVCLILYLFFLLIFVGKLIDMFFVHPVTRMALNAEQIAGGGDKWTTSLPPGDELADLNDSFSVLVQGLQQRNLLRNYVSSDAYEDLSAVSGQNLVPGGEYLEATIVFVALKNYSELTRDLPVEQSLQILNTYISQGDLFARDGGGSIDKILNHTLMLVFRQLPGTGESHALRAARTVLKLGAAVQQHFNSGINAGIASGTVISGKIGSYSGKLDFTVIGNAVNLAARLKTEACTSSSGIIISGATIKLLKGKGRVAFLRRCSVKGKAREYNIYELLQLRQ